MARFALSSIDAVVEKCLLSMLFGAHAQNGKFVWFTLDKDVPKAKKGGEGQER